MSTPKTDLIKPDANKETTDTGAKGPSASEALEDSVVLDFSIFASVAVGAVYLYLALGMFHASYFLLLIDSPDPRESWSVHALAWVWRTGLPVLVGSFVMGWNTRLCKDRRTGMLIKLFTFPAWAVAVILITLFVDAIDLLVFQ